MVCGFRQAVQYEDDRVPICSLCRRKGMPLNEDDDYLVWEPAEPYAPFGDDAPAQWARVNLGLPGIACVREHLQLRTGSDAINGSAFLARMRRDREVQEACYSVYLLSGWRPTWVIARDLGFGIEPTQG